MFANLCAILKCFFKNIKMCCLNSYSATTENSFLILSQNSNYASKVELFGMMSMKGMRICNFTLQEFT